MNRHAFLFTLCLLGSSLFAQDTTRLTLEQAIALGLSNNHQLKISDTRTRLAEAKLQQVKDAKLPKAGTSVQYSRLYLLTPFVMPEVVALPSTYFDAMIGMTSVSYEIFGGFAEKAQHETNAFLIKATELDAETDRQDVRYNITAAYYSIYKIMKSLAILEENLRAVQEREREAGNLEKEGVILSNELLKIQLQKSNLLLAKVDVKNSLQVALYNLQLALGMEENQTIGIDTTLTLDNHDVPSLDALMEEALAQRTEIKSSEYRIHAANEGWRQVRSAYYPHLEASAMHIYLNPAPNHEFIPPKDGFLNALNLGVSLKYNIYSLYGMKGKKQEVRLTIQQAENASVLQRDRVRSEVYTQYMAHQSAFEKINVAQTALAQSEESLKLSVSQFQNGLLLSGDLMQSQTLKLQAELNLLQARIDSQLAYFKLQKAVGITNH